MPFSTVSHAINAHYTLLSKRQLLGPLYFWAVALPSSPWRWWWSWKQ